MTCSSQHHAGDLQHGPGVPERLTVSGAASASPRAFWTCRGTGEVSPALRQYTGRLISSKPPRVLDGDPALRQYTGHLSSSKSHGALDGEDRWGSRAVIWPGAGIQQPLGCWITGCTAVRQAGTGPRPRSLSRLSR